MAKTKCKIMSIEIWNGLKLIKEDQLFTKWIKEMGRLDHDQNMLPLVLPHIPKGGTVIDAGAYVGDHTCAYLEAVGSDGKVLAFEPNPEAFECLEHNCPKALCLDHGLGKKCALASFQLDAGNIGGSTIAFKKRVCTGEIIVRVSDIDHVELPTLDFIKIDVEGMEEDVLRGGLKNISLHHPVMLIEINQQALAKHGSCRDRVFKLLDQLGYTYDNVYPGQKINVDDHHVDILCFPK